MCKGGLVKRFLFRFYMLLRAERLIFLGVFFRDIQIPQLLLLPKYIMKKSAWIETTGDSYGWRNESYTYLDRFYNWCRKTLLNRIPLVALTFPSNEVQYYREFGKGETTILPLGTFEKTFNFLDSLPTSSYGSKKEIWVQVGHSGLQKGNHACLLNKLRQFNEESIKVITVVTNDVGVEWKGHHKAGPLYRDAVFNIAKDFFGNKASNFGKPIDLESYCRFTHKVDILVLDVNRGAALGNVARALHLGKKVFLPSDNEYYDFWIQNGFDISDTNKIPEMTFEEFIRPPKHKPGAEKNVHVWWKENLEEYWSEFYRKLNDL